MPRVPKRPTSAAGRAFEGAFEAAISVVVAFLGGYYADRYFETGPVLTFLGFVVGGIAAFRRLLRIGNPPPGDSGREADEREASHRNASDRNGSEGNGSTIATRGSTDRVEPSTVRRGESHTDQGDHGEKGSGG